MWSAHRHGAGRWLGLGLGLVLTASLASCGSPPLSAHRPLVSGTGQPATLPASTDLTLAPSGAAGSNASQEASPPGRKEPSSPTTTPAPTCGALSLDQLVGQRFIFSFGGTVPPAGLLRRIELGQAAGVILSSSNFTSPAGLRALTEMLQALPRPATLRLPLLVMTDEEGGEVTRIPGPPLRSASETGRDASTQEALQLGEEAGAALIGGGVNMDLAPVLGVARPGSFLAAQQRTYGSSAQTVSRLGTSFGAGLARAGVIATPKHFPGLGSATISTDDAPVRIGLSRSNLQSVDEAPFAAAISAGAPAVMLSTAVYPALDGSLPAALSPVVAADELRGRLGFGGVSITDDLGAPALVAYGSPGRRATLAALAGSDLLLFAGSYESGAQAEDSLMRLAGAGGLPMPGLCASAGRVLKLRSLVPVP